MNQRNLADFTGNHQLKIKALIQLAEACKIQKKYDIAKKFLKKGLQYSWFMKNMEQESLIYDRLGIIYFLEGNLEKARDFHEKSVCFEKATHPDGVKKYLKNQNYTTD